MPEKIYIFITETKEVEEYLQRQNCDGRVLILSMARHTVHARRYMYMYTCEKLIFIAAFNHFGILSRTEVLYLSLVVLFSGFSLSLSPHPRPKQRGEDLSFMLEARVKWLTALLVQHYEGFHPDLVALNRQPTGNQRRVKYWGKVNRSSKRSPRLAPRWSSPKKKRKFEPSPPRDIYQCQRGSKSEVFSRRKWCEREKKEKERERLTDRKWERMSERREGADDKFSASTN